MAIRTIISTGIIVGSGFTILLLTYYANKMRRLHKRDIVSNKKRTADSTTSSNNTLVGGDQKYDNFKALTPCNSIDSLSDDESGFPKLRTSRKLYNQGLDSLRRCVMFWEKAIDVSKKEMLVKNNKRQSFDDMRIKLNNLYGNSKKILRMAYSKVVVDSAIEAASNYTLRSEMEEERITIEDSDDDSFITAIESAHTSTSDLSFAGSLSLIYQEGFRAAKCNSVKCRIMRTELVECKSDVDFLAKVYCIRNCFDTIFEDSEKRQFITESCTLVLRRMLILNNAESDKFVSLFQQLQTYVEENVEGVLDEFEYRGIAKNNFYDIIIDYMLLDAFQEMELPPASMIAVIRHRWLSHSVKQMAISTAIWSILKAKRCKLLTQTGFFGRYYDMCEIISPTLAYGFFGSTGTEINKLCLAFKEEVIVYVKELFKYNGEIYQDYETLCNHIWLLTRICINNIKNEIKQ